MRSRRSKISGLERPFSWWARPKLNYWNLTDPEGPIGKFLEKKGERESHHLAFAFENATDALKSAEEKGTILIDKVSRKGAEGMNIGFFAPEVKPTEY